MTSPPVPDTLALAPRGDALFVTLNRPQARNAMNAAMVAELRRLCAWLDAPGSSLRAVVLRGAGGHFCAGGDIVDMAGAMAAPIDATGDPVARLNRSFGHMLQAVQGLGVPVIAVCEGAVMGGGFGLACVADVTVAVEGARFRLPETGLGITPAQVMPFIVRRIGLAHGRRLAVTGQTLDAQAALAVGLADQVLATGSDVEGAVDALLAAVFKCEPKAVAATKRLALRAAGPDLGPVLDQAAVDFAAFARSSDAAAGMAAFLNREPAPWVPQES